MRARAFLLATVLALPAAAGAATVVDKTIAVTIRPEGSVREHTSLRVRLESREDLGAWSLYPIYLDENRSLETVRAFAVRPDGSQLKVKRKDQDETQHSGSSTHSSARFHTLEFSGLTVGTELDIVFAVEVEPYYSADSILLLGDEDVERLEVTVRGGGDAWRWRIDGPAEGLELEETAGGVTVTASGLAAVDAPHLAPDGAVYPVLRYAWGREGSWREVGSWYADLLSGLPRHAEPVRGLARELTAGLDDPRQRLEALLAFMRQKVRYVAVEVGIGGYRPSAPAEVLERKWGDCKDKSLLFIDLLHEVGVEAYPVLIRSDRSDRIDVEFPSPGQFNHLIVAVPSTAVDHEADDPVADGYFFLDPTQERGSGSWLIPSDQDQDVLVVRDGTGELARTPLKPWLESRRLQVTLHVTPEGKAVGGAGLALKGWLATAFIDQIATAAPERTEEDARQIFAALLPGATVGRVGWSEKEGSVPGVDMSAAVTVERLVEGLGSRPSFKLVGLKTTPEPRLLEERDVPLVLRPRSTVLTWSLALPAGWCRPKVAEQRVENALGTFAQSIAVAGEGNHVIVERKTELRRRWITPQDLGALRELALAEHRAHRRRIRLECEE